jgi:hypothetical protein
MERKFFVDVLTEVLTKCSLDSDRCKSSLKFGFCFEQATNIKYQNDRTNYLQSYKVELEERYKNNTNILLMLFCFFFIFPSFDLIN